MRFIFHLVRKNQALFRLIGLSLLLINNSNKNAKIILSMGKQNMISKILMILAGEPKAHDNIISTYNEQLQIFKKFCKILKIKKNIYYMTDIYLGEFI